MKTLGLIGMGNMGRAIAEGIIAGGAMTGEQLYAYSPTHAKLVEACEPLGICACESALELVTRVDAVLIAVKPHKVAEVVAPLKEALKGKVLLSVALGWDFERYAEVLDPSTRHLFIMPNTPVSVGEGVLIFEARHSLKRDEYAAVETLFSEVGKVFSVPSELMDIAGTLSGCSPAFVAMILEAMGDAGVLYGLPRELSYTLAAQTLLGSAKLRLETGTHPGALKDAVCSPGGSTIRGVASLERDGVRSAMIRAIGSAVGRA